MINIIKSTIIVIIVSAIGALGASLFHLNFIAAFLLLFATQYIVFSFLASVINNYYKEQTKQKQLDTLEPLSTILECSYCNTKNVMTFLPDENQRVEMECESCKKRSIVNMQFVVARITEHVNVNTNPLANENIEE
jgi:hypothetical protein